MTDEQTQERIDDDKLQRFFDGDLTEGEAKVLQRDIDASDLEGARLDQLARLSDLMRIGVEATQAIDSNALFERIEAKIEAEPAPRLQVIEGQKRKRTWGVVAVGLAAAAAVALVFFQSQPTEIAEHPMDDPRQVLVENHPEVQVHPPSGSEVLEVDFGANTGTVFEVEGAEGQPLAVVWIAE
ncbi:MAG: hypothetical protein AAF411_04175 [Myxococcota bacterium]